MDTAFLLHHSHCIVAFLGMREIEDVAAAVLLTPSECMPSKLASSALVATPPPSESTLQSDEFAADDSTGMVAAGTASHQAMDVAVDTFVVMTTAWNKEVAS